MILKNPQNNGLFVCLWAYSEECCKIKDEMQVFVSKTGGIGGIIDHVECHCFDRMKNRPFLELGGHCFQFRGFVRFE